MPKIELRCCHPSNIRKYSLLNDIDILSIGNQSCVHRLPSFDEIKSLINKIDKDVKIELPFIPQEHLEFIKNYLYQLLSIKDDISIVLNDYGLINFLNHLDKKTNFKMFIGRAFEKTIDSIIWKENILRDEPKSIRDDFKQSSFAHSYKLKLFKKLNIYGIETNLTEGAAKSFSKITDYGLEVYTHYDNIAVAMSRVCAVKRYKTKSIPFSGNCRDLCTDIYKLDFIKEWTLKTKNETSFESLIRENFKPLYVNGNFVFRKNELAHCFFNEQITGLILNDYCTTIENIEKNLKMLKSFNEIFPRGDFYNENNVTCK